MLYYDCKYLIIKSISKCIMLCVTLIRVIELNYTFMYMHTYIDMKHL